METNLRRSESFCQKSESYTHIWYNYFMIFMTFNDIHQQWRIKDTNSIHERNFKKYAFLTGNLVL